MLVMVCLLVNMNFFLLYHSSRWGGNSGFPQPAAYLPNNSGAEGTGPNSLIRRGCRPVPENCDRKLQKKFAIDRPVVVQ